MKNIQNLTIDINKKPFQTITANTGETASRFIRITILDNNMPLDLTGVSVYLYAKKPDGTKVFNNVTIEDKANGIVLAELTSQALVVEGLVKLTLLLVKNNAKLCSKQFLLNVDKSIVDDEAIESSNEFGALTTSLSKVNEWNSYFEETSGKIEEKYIERLNNIDLQLEKKATNDIDATMLKSVFGAKGDGVTDDTLALQSAINYIHDNFKYGSLELCRNGLYVISDTLLVPANVCIRGAYGGKEEAKPTITWYGSAGKNMIEVGKSSASSNLHESPFKNFNMRGKGRNASNFAKNGIVFKQRCDLGCYVEDLSLHLFEEHAIVYEKGGLNVHCRNFRIDGVGVSAIEWRPTGLDYFSIDGFTCDGNITINNVTKCGGVLDVNIDNSNNDARLHFNISNAKIEVNTNPVQPLFNFNVDKNRQIFHITSFSNVFVTNLHSYTGIKFTPTSYDSSCILTNCIISSIEGLNGFSDNGNSYHSLTVVTPNTVSNSLSSGGYRSRAKLYCDVDIDNLYSKGRKVSNIIRVNPSDTSTKTSYKAGDWLINDTSDLCRYIQEVKTPGTIGVTNGATGTLSSGTNLLHVSSCEPFNIGDYITIGTDSRRITNIQHATNRLVLSSNVNNSYADEDISFTPPTYNNHQLIAKRHWYPTNSSHGTFKKGDIIFNTDVKIGAYAGWICSEAGSPGVWLGFGKLESTT